MNNFACGQTLLFNEEDMKNIKEKYGKRLILEQNGATAHTCKSSKHLLEKLFTENCWIQNPPNSLHLAYPKRIYWVLLNLELKEGILHH